MRKLASNKRGQVLNLVGGTIVGIMILIFMIFAVLYAVAVLNPSSFFASGSASANATNVLTNNLTAGVAGFAGIIPNTLLVLGIVLVLSAILILIMYVKKMGSSEGSGSL